MAAPIVVWLKEREPRNRALAERLATGRVTGGSKASRSEARADYDLAVASEISADADGDSETEMAPTSSPTGSGSTSAGALDRHAGPGRAARRHPAAPAEEGQEALTERPWGGLHGGHVSFEAQLRSSIRDIPDFPKPGVTFKDITPLLNDPVAFAGTVDALAGAFITAKVDRVLGVEARGFIFAAPVAYRLGAGFVPVRKAGKLPVGDRARGVRPRVRHRPARDAPRRRPRR